MVLAFMNLLPIPALDGGHVIFLLVEMVRRKPLSYKFLEVAQMVGMVLLFLLMGFALYNDFAQYVFKH
jgi:regulator of sigma E protease